MKVNLEKGSGMAKFELMIPALVIGGALNVTFAQPAVYPVRLDIESKPLDEAIATWAAQTGYQVLIPAEQRAISRVAPVVKGEYTPKGALEVLLADTSFSYQFVNSSTVAIRSADSGGEPRAETASSGKIEEVVVTAQKREERIQDVPISISVMSGTELDKSPDTGVIEALNRVPGVLIQELLGLNRIMVRGVSAVGSRSNGASPIAYYLDSVPFGFVKSALVPDAGAYDLDRVEVMRGPQGTLYGASALNGVVRVLSKDADPDRFAFKARTSASGTQSGGENYRGDLSVNVPIIEGKLAVRAAAGYQSLAGWIDRPNQEEANDGDVTTLRLKIRAQPTERLTLDSLLWSSKTDMDGPPYSADNKTNSSLVDEPSTVEYDMYGLQAAYDFAAFTLNSSSSYIDFFTENYADFAQLGFPAGTRLQTRMKNHLFAQEVVLTSTHGGPWRWSAGGMYRDATDRTYFYRLGYVAPNDASDLSESFAVFGELTRSFFDGRLELTGGLRYFEDDVSQIEYSRTNGVTPLGVDPGDTFDSVSPRAVVTWHPNSQLNVYASYSEGFRSGFLQIPLTVQVAPQIPPADPDTLVNYELGAKGDLLGGRVVFDTAVYFMDWQDVQQVVAVTVPGVSSLFSAVVNGVSASGPGFDFGLSTQPLAGLGIGLNFSWNDLEFDAPVISAGTAIAPAGARPNATPEFTYGGSVDYDFPLGSGGFSARFSASANYVSEQTTTSLVAGNIVRQSSDTILIAKTSFAINAPKNWSATFFIDNLDDENGVLTRSPNTPQWHTRVRPRTYGVQLEYSF